MLQARGTGETLEKMRWCDGDKQVEVYPSRGLESWVVGMVEARALEVRGGKTGSVTIGAEVLVMPAGRC